ncbi:MAG: AraC family transcriptional regulator, partial [Acidobacteriota bacterium]
LQGAYCSVFWIRAVAALRAYRRRYEANFSNVDSLRLQFLKAFVSFIGAIYAAHIAMPLVGTLLDLRFPVTPLEGLLLLGLIYLVLYYLVRRPQIFLLTADHPGPPPSPAIDPRAVEKAAVPSAEAPAADAAWPNVEVPRAAAEPDPTSAPDVIAATAPDRQKYARQSLDAETRRGLLERIQGFMDTERPYLDGELALADLAQAVGVPKHHFSMAINIELEQNFFQFVNGYRVSEARRLLADPSLADENVLSIAYRAGFQSKAAFNKVFKKATGQTPGQYRADAARADR